MVWKRGQVLLAMAVLLIVSSAGAAAHAGGKDHTGCGPNFTENVLPYGTKEHGLFMSPGLHGLRLVHYIQVPILLAGHDYQLRAENPVSGNVPDFDIVFEFSNGGTLRHGDDGDQGGTVPQNAIGAYVFMPVGPDMSVGFGNPSTAAMGEFRFSQC